MKKAQYRAEGALRAQLQENMHRSKAKKTHQNTTDDCVVGLRTVSLFIWEIHVSHISRR